jgi:hypothetical protein
MMIDRRDHDRSPSLLMAKLWFLLIFFLRSEARLDHGRYCNGLKEDILYIPKIPPWPAQYLLLIEIPCSERNGKTAQLSADQSLLSFITPPTRGIPTVPDRIPHTYEVPNNESGPVLILLPVPFMSLTILGCLLIMNGPHSS